MLAAYRGGVNFFDNAEGYAAGDAEKLMGDVVRLGIERRVWTRADLVLSTKLFFGAIATKGSDDYIPGAMIINRTGLSRKHVIEGMLGSLSRMGVDYVDVVFCHRPDPITPIEEVVRAFNYLIDRGYCFYWGTSEWSAEQLLQAKLIADRLNLVAPCCDQPEYNMFKRDRVEVEYAPLYPASSMGLGLTTWSPLASGVLTGKYKDGIPAGSRLASASFQKRPDYKTKFERPIALAERLRPIAQQLNCSMGQLALAWCIKNPNVSTVITGATTTAQVAENLGAVDVVDKLTNDVMAQIDKLLAEYVSRESWTQVNKQVSYRKSRLSDGAKSKL
eukprot:TRINITY_DN8245_c0_g3_i2.p1 TRINITY_DN8245_c0_g3~~TRINITY_DN8245_c0_g3_i2.p1  ORF type:complete len:332 (+),score=43.32 TRINITY_DN8245_c0_g3_i2:86-1081(+)